MVLLSCGVMIGVYGCMGFYLFFFSFMGTRRRRLPTLKIKAKPESGVRAPRKPTSERAEREASEARRRRNPGDGKESEGNGRCESQTEGAELAEETCQQAREQQAQHEHRKMKQLNSCFEFIRSKTVISK